jgi:tetratricopeptide (TPR) repeat protein
MVVMDPELARMSRATDPLVIGQRIRHARVAAGLTQEQLGAGAASAAYISRIEAGNRRPGLRLLAHVADRLGTSVERLVCDEGSGPGLEAGLRVDYAELALKSGEPATALAGVQEVLATGAEGLTAAVRVRARWIKACALEVEGDYPQAIAELESLVAEAPRGLLWIEMAMALSRCYLESGDLTRAIEVGDVASQEIERLELSGTEQAIRLTLQVATAHIDRGDLGLALRICERAADQAERLGSGLACASAYWNASVVRVRQGDVPSAVELAEKALAIFETDADARSRALLLGTLAGIRLRQVPPDVEGAESNIQKALEISAWSDTSKASRATLWLISARVLLRQGRTAEALEIAKEAVASVGEDAPLVASEALIVQGRIALQEGHKSEAVGHFHRAVLLLNACGADRSVAECWFELGALLQEAGEDSAAADAYRSAAAATGLRIPPMSTPTTAMDGSARAAHA